MGGLGTEYSVAKAIIVVTGAPSTYLMSIKRDPGSRNEAKLEFLGGRMEEGETPLEAIVRELKEEEATGALSEIVRESSPLHVQHKIRNATHHLFSIEISEKQFRKLKHDPMESHGFRLIEGSMLQECHKRYTRKTNRIIDLLSLPLEAGSS